MIKHIKFLSLLLVMMMVMPALAWAARIDAPHIDVSAKADPPAKVEVNSSGQYGASNLSSNTGGVTGSTNLGSSSINVARPDITGQGHISFAPTKINTNKSVYVPSRTLPTNAHGVPIPDTNFPHTQLGLSKKKYGSEPQAREWDYGDNGNLQPKRDIDFTDHGNAKAHPHVPHQHKLTPNNPKLAPEGGYTRGSGEPL